MCRCDHLLVIVRSYAFVFLRLEQAPTLAQPTGNKMAARFFTAVLKAFPSYLRYLVTLFEENKRCRTNYGTKSCPRETLYFESRRRHTSFFFIQFATAATCFTVFHFSEKLQQQVVTCSVQLKRSSLHVLAPFCSWFLLCRYACFQNAREF